MRPRSECRGRQCRGPRGRGGWRGGRGGRGGEQATALDFADPEGDLLDEINALMAGGSEPASHVTLTLTLTCP